MNTNERDGQMQLVSCGHIHVGTFTDGCGFHSAALGSGSPCMVCGKPLHKDERKVCTDCRISAHRKDPLPPEAYVGPKLTVLKAIHTRCVDCNSDPGVDVRAWARCDFDGIRQELCPLWPYRKGKNPNLRGIMRNNALQLLNALRKGLPSRKTPARPSEGEDRELERRLAAQTRPLRAARSHCLWCCMGQAHEVRLCSCVSCSLWPFRFGRRPKATVAGCDSGAGKNSEGIEGKKSKSEGGIVSNGSEQMRRS